MAKDVADLVRKFHAAANEAPKTFEEQKIKAAQRTKGIYLGGAQRAGLTPGKKMNVGKKGARWGVRYDELKAGQVLVRFTGPVHLVNNDTSPHRILTAAGKAQQREQGRVLVSALTNTKVRRARRTSGPRALALPTGPVASVKHPGTRGKNFFRPADDFARAESTRIVAKSHTNYLTRAGFGR